MNRPCTLLTFLAAVTSHRATAALPHFPALHPTRVTVRESVLSPEQHSGRWTENLNPSFVVTAAIFHRSRRALLVVVALHSDITRLLGVVDKPTGTLRREGMQIHR